MKKLLGMPKDTFMPLSAVIAFFALIVILFMVKRSGRNTIIGYSAQGVPVRRRRRRRVRKGRAVPAIASGRGWRRRWDQMSGSSTYSKPMMGRRIAEGFTVA